MRTLLLALTVTAALAAPKLEQGPLWTLRNEHVAITFDPAHGGFPTRIADAQGRVWLTDGGAYTDFGLFEGRTNYGSRHATGKLASRQEGGALTVTATGVFTPEAGPAGDVAYELAATLTDAPAADLRITLTPGHERELNRAFLATLFTVPQVAEWYAYTVDGRVNQAVHGTGRSYQSSGLPLDPDCRRLGLVYRDGRRLELEPAATGPLSNVFLHETEQGVVLFLAWLDGDRLITWPANQPWQLTAHFTFISP